MNQDEDPLDLLEDDGDGVIEMCQFFDEDSKKDNSKGPSQGKGCCVALFLIGDGVISAGVLLEKLLA